MTPQPNLDPFDEMRADLIRLIDRHGYTTIVVGSGECSVPGCNCEPEPHTYAYSLGVFDHDHPELVLFGMPLSHVNSLTDPVYAAAAAGTPLAVGREHRHTLDCGATISLVPVPELWLRRDPGRIGCWLDMYGAANGLPAFVQICWADGDGSMPWEASCQPAVAALQPVLADDPLRFPRPPRNRARHGRRRAR